MAAGAACGVAGVDLGWRSAICRNLEDVAATIEDQAQVVLAPVRRLKPATFGINKFAARVVAGCDGLQRTEQYGCSCGGRCELLQLNVGEGCLFNCVLIVRAEADAHIKRAVEMELDGRAYRMQGFACHRYVRSEEH